MDRSTDEMEERMKTCKCGEPILVSHRNQCLYCWSGSDVPPPWLQRAERKEFMEGDVVFVSLKFTKGPATVISHQDNYQTVKHHDPGSDIDPIMAVFNEHLTLLRPVDWEPTVGERVVCIERGVIGHVNTVDSYSIRVFDAWRDEYAPAILAEPLIPLLRGEVEVKDIHVNECESCEGCPSPVDGKPLCPVEFDETGPGILGPNMSQRAIDLRERWTSTWFEPVYCRRCGHSRGCMCRRAQ